MTRITDLLRDGFWNMEVAVSRVLSYFGWGPVLDGPRPHRVIYDEVDLIGTSEVLQERNDRLMKWMRWQADCQAAGFAPVLKTWVPADGRTLEKADYPKLWSAIKAGAGFPDPWLDLGGIEFDFPAQPKVVAYKLDDFKKFMEFVNPGMGFTFDGEPRGI